MIRLSEIWTRGTVEIRKKEPVFIRTLKLNFHLLSPLNKNIKKPESGSGSYITGFKFFELGNLRCFQQLFNKIIKQGF